MLTMLAGSFILTAHVDSKDVEGHGNTKCWGAHSQLRETAAWGGAIHSEQCLETQTSWPSHHAPASGKRAADRAVGRTEDKTHIKCLTDYQKSSALLN